MFGIDQSLKNRSAKTLVILLLVFLFAPITIRAQEQRGFTGHEFDPESGLLYMRQRYYAPATPGFLSQDPLVRALGDRKMIQSITSMTQEEILMNPQMLNTHAYALSNPVANVDLQGEFSTKAALLNPVGTFAQVAFWKAGSYALQNGYIMDGNRALTAKLLSHSVSYSPGDIEITQQNQGEYGNVVNQLQNSKDFITVVRDQISAHSSEQLASGLQGSIDLPGDLHTALGRFEYQISGTNNGDVYDLEISITDTYNFELHVKYADYDGAAFVNSANNVAAISEFAEAVTPYTVRIKMPLILKNDGE